MGKASLRAFDTEIHFSLHIHSGSVSILIFGPQFMMLFVGNVETLWHGTHGDQSREDGLDCYSRLIQVYSLHFLTTVMWIRRSLVLLLPQGELLLCLL